MKAIGRAGLGLALLCVATGALAQPAGFPATVPATAPPLFDAIALDDMVFASKDFPIAAAWLAAKRPVEIHGYQTGNHGFGLGQPGTSNTLLIDEFVAWLAMNQFLSPAKK